MMVQVSLLRRVFVAKKLEAGGMFLHVASVQDKSGLGWVLLRVW